VIRELREADAAGVAAVEIAANPHQVVTPELVWHRATRGIEREQRRDWVAELEGRVAGCAHAGFEWSVPTRGKGRFWVGVLPELRGRGVGGELYAYASEYLRSRGAWRLRTWVDEDLAGARFLERLGFTPRDVDRVSELDLRGAELPEPSVAAGFRLVPLAEVRDHVDDLFAISASGELDMPGKEAETELRIEDWKAEELHAPTLSHDGSFVALEGSRPLAAAYLVVDPTRRLGSNQMTATLPAFRRRGLALAAKLAVARWAAAHGFERLVTENDTANLGMLAINDRLGYRPLYDQVAWVLELGEP
jgi:GNAT superfamily N-acetyltransferase